MTEETRQGSRIFYQKISDLGKGYLAEVGGVNNGGPEQFRLQKLFETEQQAKIWINSMISLINLQDKKDQ